MLPKSARWMFLDAEQQQEIAVIKYEEGCVASLPSDVGRLGKDGGFQDAGGDKGLDGWQI